MTLRLLTGAPNAGKTGRLYEAIRDLTARGGRAILLLPSAPDVVRARAELAVGATIGVQVEQFDRFGDAEWAHHGDGRRIAGSSL